MRTSATAESTLGSNTSGAARILEVETRAGFTVSNLQGNESCGLEEILDELHTGNSNAESDDEDIVDFEFFSFFAQDLGSELIRATLLCEPILSSLSKSYNNFFILFFFIDFFTFGKVGFHWAAKKIVGPK